MASVIDGWPIPRTSPEQWPWPGSVTGFADLADFCRKHAPDPGADRTVDSDGIKTAQDLADLLSGQLRKVHALAPDRPAGRQELLCAEDVAAALGELLPSRNPAAGFAMLGSLIDIPVIVSPDSPPGTWRLVTHDGCKVRGLDGDEPDATKAWVSHER